jgi:hypothetical protein
MSEIKNEQKPVELLTCLNCGRVHVSYPLVCALQAIDDFNKFYDTLSPENQQDYYGGHKESMTAYTECFRCGGSYKNFRAFQDGDCPNGVTLSPILNKDEDYVS